MKKTEILFASTNRGKIKEVRKVFDEHLTHLLFRNVGEVFGKLEIPETKDTYYGNALEKALFIQREYKGWVLAEDSGLEVDALQGAPGVYSHRYAGTGKDEDNIKKLLGNLCAKKDRKASLMIQYVLVGPLGQRVARYGRTRGVISLEPKGEEGFGYDKIFIPKGSGKTLAEVPIFEKEKIINRKTLLIRLFGTLNLGA